MHCQKLVANLAIDEVNKCSSSPLGSKYIFMLLPWGSASIILLKSPMEASGPVHYHRSEFDVLGVLHRE